MTATPQRFWIVRHACAGTKGSRPDRLDDERPLDSAGIQQAELLCQVLTADRPTRLVSSPAVRCVQTLEPLARASGLAVELSPDLGPESGVESLAGALRAPQYGAVLSTHGEVMHALTDRFAELDVVVDDRDADHLLLKGTAWRLERAEPGWSLTVVSPAPRLQCPEHTSDW